MQILTQHEEDKLNNITNKIMSKYKIYTLHTIHNRV